MEHKHEVIDQDCSFYIDPAKDMAITCEGTVKGLKRGDMGAEVYSFSMPRYIEGHDMSTCNKVEVHFNNIHKDRTTREITTNRSFDEVEGFGVTKEDEDTVTWTWKPSGDATQLDGTLAFCIRFACMEGAEITYQKFSGTFESIPVGETIWNTEEMAKEYADVLEQWRQELLAAIETVSVTDEQVAAAVDAYMANHPVSGGGIPSAAANLLIEILESAVYSANVTGKIQSLKAALTSGGGGGDTPDTPDTPEEPDEPVITDDITVSDGGMTIVSVGSAITVSDGVITIV